MPRLQELPWRRAWQPTPVFLPEESPWTEKPGRQLSVGSQRVRHDTATQTAQRLFQIYVILQILVFRFILFLKEAWL